MYSLDRRIHSPQLSVNARHTRTHASAPSFNAHPRARLPPQHLPPLPPKKRTPVCVWGSLEETYTMGKTRGHGSRRGAYRGRGGSSRGRGGDDEGSDSDEERYEQQRSLGEARGGWVHAQQFHEACSVWWWREAHT